MPNFFAEIPPRGPEEWIETLVNARSVRIERIVSQGHTSPPDFWYEQTENEWVIVLSGHAKLIFEDDPSPLDLKPGDYVHIESQRRHRVDWTGDQPTIWLAVFY
jgi:cupin 2 domain-containing protein